MSEPKVFEYHTTIRETQLDVYGHVNNAAYLTLFEEARWELITERGYGLDVIKKLQKGPVLLETHARYLKELKQRQKITVVSQMEEQRGKVGKMKQLIVDDQGEHCCEATFTVGFFDLQKRKLTEPTEEWLRALGLRD